MNINSRLSKEKNIEKIMDYCEEDSFFPRFEQKKYFIQMNPDGEVFIRKK